MGFSKLTELTSDVLVLGNSFKIAAAFPQWLRFHSSVPQIRIVEMQRRAAKIAWYLFAANNRVVFHLSCQNRVVFICCQKSRGISPELPIRCYTLP